MRGAVPSLFMLVVYQEGWTSSSVPASPKSTKATCLPFRQAEDTGRIVAVLIELPAGVAGKATPAPAANPPEPPTERAAAAPSPAVIPASTDGLTGVLGRARALSSYATSARAAFLSPLPPGAAAAAAWEPADASGEARMGLGLGGVWKSRAPK